MAHQTGRAARRAPLALAAVLVAASSAAIAAPALAATPTELFFSEVIEGSSNNKALEIYNGTDAAVNLTTGGYSVQMFFNGSATAGLTLSLTGTVAPGDVFVIAQASATATVLAQADQVNASGWFNGDDAVVLRKGSSVIDAFGQVGFDPGTEWGSGLASTGDNTLRRAETVCAGDPDGSNAFDPAVEWIGYATDTFDGLGSHTATCDGSGPDEAPAVAAIAPADGATGVPASANATVTFTEPVNVSGAWFTLECSLSGSHPATVSGGPIAFTLDPTTDFQDGDACTLTVLAAGVTDQDAADPPDSMVADTSATFEVADVCARPYTPIPEIQGSGATVALTGTRTTQGVVVGDYEGASPALRGFFIQDPTGDGDPTTSDAIFVFEGSNADTVSVGDLVRVTGTAGENQGQSQVSVGSIVVCGTGSVAPTDVTFPLAAPDDLERVEGMLVRLPQAMTVTEHFQLGRFGQVVLSQGGRLQVPTAVVDPGADALALSAANDLRAIILDDASQGQNPDPIEFARGGLPLSASNTLRGGDTATGIVGVMTYTWAGNSASGNAFRIRPLGALGGSVLFEPANPRPDGGPGVGGTTRVAGLNLLNYFDTFDGLPDSVDNCALGVGGAATDCRGADTQAEFDRQWPKTVAAILSLNAHVVGVNELENDGYGADSAIAHLVDRLNDATAPGTWAFIDADAATGSVNALGVDAIKVGMLYRPGAVTPVGDTAVLATDAFVKGGDSEIRTRPSLAQAFEVNATGARFVVNANHFKSKGSACDAPDAGDGQGNCNAVRVQAATELAAWLAADPTGTGEDDVLLIGDYNSYAMEDPITVLRSAGYTNLVREFLGPDAYSYVFDGEWGYLDHALASPSLLGQVSGVADVHINADEPSVLDYNTNFKSAGQVASLYAPDRFRVSDHDPVVVGLDLEAVVVDPPVVTPEPSEEGEVAVAAATFTGPDAATATCTVDHGDGSGPVAGTVADGTCTGPGHVYASYGTYEVTVTVVNGSGERGSATASHVVVFAFDGFHGPIGDDAMRSAKAGSAVPVTFSLGGDRGLGILAEGSPSSRPVACADATPAAPGEDTATAGASGLQYDPATSRYTYVWKTKKAWDGTCRELVLTLVDGTTHTALFDFRH